jgi:SAM-dependent methyltransferase
LGTDAHVWDRRYSAPDLVWGAQPNRRLVTEVEALPPGRALDLGGGEGRNAVWLASRGWDVTIVDFSRAGLERAGEMAQRAGVHLTAVQADVGEYAPAAGHYDLAIMMYLQVPGTVLRTAVAGATQALAPGGTFLLIGHDIANLERGHGGPQDPTILQSPEQVTSCFGDDIEVLAAERIDRVVDTPHGPRTAIDTLVRARRTPPDR